MVAKSESVLINQNLRSALKAGLLALAFFWVRSSDFNFGAVILFTLFFILIYFRPIFNAGRFSISALTTYSLVFLTPYWPTLEAYLALAWGSLIFALLGVKNLTLLKRQGGYEIVHSSLILGSSALYFAGSIPQIILFVSLFFLFREFYFNTSSASLPRLVLLGAILAMLLVEVAWLLTFTPLSPLVAAGLVALSAFLLHDTLVHYLKETMSRELILRNITIFVLMILVIVALPI